MFEVTHSEWRVWIMFLFSFVYSIAGYKFVYTLMIKLKEYKRYDDENPNNDSEVLLAKRTVMVKNVPPYFSTKY